MTVGPACRDYTRQQPQPLAQQCPDLIRSRPDRQIMTKIAAAAERNTELAFLSRQVPKPPALVATHESGGRSSPGLCVKKL